MRRPSSPWRKCTITASYPTVILATLRYSISPWLCLWAPGPAESQLLWIICWVLSTPKMPLNQVSILYFCWRCWTFFSCDIIMFREDTLTPSFPSVCVCVKPQPLCIFFSDKVRSQVPEVNWGKVCRFCRTIEGLLNIMGASIAFSFSRKQNKTCNKTKTSMFFCCSL